MTASVPVIGLDHEQVTSEGEIPLETAWSEEDDCVPLKQRLKMLHAKAVSRNREETLISDRSPVDDSVRKDDELCDSLVFHSDYEGSVDDIKISEEFLEDLDHVVLIERQRMLLSRSSTSSMILPNAQIESGGSDLCGTSSPTTRSDIIEKCDDNDKDNTSCDPTTSQSQNYKNVKLESLDYDIQTPNKDIPITVSPCLPNQVPIKSEPVNTEIFDDIIDHMMLGDRMRLLASRNFPKSHLYGNSENSRVFTSFGNEDKPTSSESSKPFLLKRPRKRRKTATDSIETALEEDAPGLLQVLIEKGVLADEIKLYGETDDDEALDIEESFSELEEVIEKIFSQRQSFLKLGPIRCGRGEKASYCLACLISLVEQARYLRLRKWPVEWGWCRDLQSFIFVFERHNRIVLERPEYGYATYFFELVDALPVNWQIKRLITTMKLTSCGRITLIENRPLTVGNDLSEGEARVLMEYGWVPDTGLGTMLNYRDRVVHDRKNESESSEWRSKIGKLLTDAYNGGTIVPNDIPKKVMEFDFGYTSKMEIKLEE